MITLQFSCPDLASESALQRIITDGIIKETRSEICHVDIETPEGTLIGAHIEDGIRERPHDYQAWGIRLRYTIPTSQEQAELALAYARRMIGTAYDVRSIFGICLGDARLHDASRLICSSFAATAVDDASGIVKVDKVKCLVSPEELRMVVAAVVGAVFVRVDGNGSIAQGVTHANG